VLLADWDICGFTWFSFEEGKKKKKKKGMRSERETMSGKGFTLVFELLPK